MTAQPSIDELCETYPTISCEEVEEALAFDDDHRAEIDRHYRLLHLRVRSHSGFVILPDSRLDWQDMRVAMLLDWAATFPDLQQRLIGGLRLAGYDEDDVRLSMGQMV